MRHLGPLLPLALFGTLVGVASNAHARDPVTAAVVRVPGGDIIEVRTGDQLMCVRYIGIRVLDIEHPTKGPQPYADAARDANRRLVEGKTVRLVFDAQERSQDGCLVAYVYADLTHVNAELVFRGYAEAATYPPNVRYADYYRALQRQAVAGHRGLWADSEVLTYYRPASDTVEAKTGWSGTAPPAPLSDSGGAASGSGYSLSGGGPKSVYVHGYTRQDGTYVAPYMRSAPRR